jgi:hypothetical protein
MSLVNVERLREIAEVEFAGIVVEAFIYRELSRILTALSPPSQPAMPNPKFNVPGTCE